MVDNKQQLRVPSGRVKTRVPCDGKNAEILSLSVDGWTKVMRYLYPCCNIGSGHDELDVRSWSVWRTRDGRRSITVHEIREMEKRTVKIKSKLEFAFGDATRIQSHVAIVLKIEGRLQFVVWKVAFRSESNLVENTNFLKTAWLTTRIF